MSLTLSATTETAQAAVSTANWGMVNGKPVYLYSITNSSGMKLEMTNFGAKITSLLVPDFNGELDDVVLGFDNLESYIEPNPSFGATIGRYSNRIRDGRFTINNVTYQSVINENSNNIHGGGEFENVVWDSEIISSEQGDGVRFSYLSPDGGYGFPGNLDSVVTYILTDDNAVYISFEAETDKATHVNFTQHSYFNLNGVEAPILDHQVRIDADSYVVMDGVLATGEIDSLEGKPWDLSQPTRLGDKMDQIPLGGYHHNYVASKPRGELATVAEVYDPASGRSLKVSTTQPGVVFYAAMGLTTGIVGKYGIRYEPYSAFCLETQHHIDALNHPEFPSTLLRPGEKYHEIVIYDFDVRQP
jgi:aldose 1-epimerase